MGRGLVGCQIFFHCGGLEQSLMNGRRGGTVLRCEQHIARAFGQAVVFADNGARHNLNLQPKLPDHILDYRNLLKIFHSEERLIGLHNIEQLADNLRHTVEMAGAVLAFHHLVETVETEHAGVGLGVHLFNRRRENGIATNTLEQGAIFVNAARIILKVVLVVELRGVDKNAHNRHIAFAQRPLHKRQVPFVQSAHCGHKTNGFAVRAALFQVVGKVGFFTNNVHFVLF